MGTLNTLLLLVDVLLIRNLAHVFFGSLIRIALSTARRSPFPALLALAFPDSSKPGREQLQRVIRLHIGRTPDLNAPLVSFAFIRVNVLPPDSSFLLLVLEHTRTIFTPAYLAEGGRNKNGYNSQYE